MSTKNITHNEFLLSDRRRHRVCKQALGKKDALAGSTKLLGWMEKSGSVDQRSLTPFISFLMGKAKQGLTVSELDKQCSTPLIITRSLLTVFLARKSLSETWIPPKKLPRWIRASQDLLHRLCKFSSDEAIQYSKYWLDHLLVLLTKDINDEPKPQEKFSEPLFTGMFKRMIDRCLLKEDGRFILSLQRGAKLIWPALSQAAKINSFNDHKKNICGKSKVLGLEMDRDFDFDRPEYFSADNFNVDLKDTLQLVSHELFSGICSEDLSKLTPPSKACYERSRRGGGPQFMQPRIGGLPKQTLVRVPGPPCFAPAPEPSVIGGQGLLPLISQRINGHRQRTHELAIEGLLDCPGDKLGDIEVMAVAEAAKFRILNKMRGNLVIALQPLQGAMLGKWKDHPTSTMRHQDLTEKVSELVRGIPDRLKTRFNKFACIDYKGATDTLPRRASYVALSGLPNGPWKELAKASFIRGTAAYPKVVDILEDGTTKTLQEASLQFQNEGQLMGHLLSFPLLCVINLSCYRLAVHRWSLNGDKEELAHRADEKFTLLNNVIVNGDDMLFRADDELYRIFDDCRKEAGFVYSAGKNYFSEQWALINSQLFKINKNKIKSCVRRFHYLNQRLLEGSSLKSGDSQATPMDIARDLNVMVENVPWTRCVIPTVFERWPQFGNYNWFLPVELGGMGVNVKFASDKLKFTRFQRMFAAYLVKHPEVGLLKKLDLALIPSIVTHDVEYARPIASQSGALVGEVSRPSREEKAVLERLLKIAIPTMTITEDPGDVPDLPWLERLAYYAELNGYSGMRNAEIIKSGWMAANFPKNFDCKPLTDREIQKYWNCGWRCESSVVPVPPLHPIRCRFDVNTVTGADDVVTEYTILPGRAVQWGLGR